MASAFSGIAKMSVQYEWILENVEEEPETFVSKMILFRGEKVFRVGLKNNVERPFLFFVAVDLNKMGIKVEQIMWGQVLHGGFSPAKMWQMTKQEIGDEGSLHLFKSYLQKQVIGNRTFMFRIQMEGSVPGFSYQLSDRLAKNQLWDSATVNSQRPAVDVELNVRDRTFSAHKAILAARSPVFANEFAKKQPLTNSPQKIPQKIQIDGVEPSTVEQFLYFMYTGESVSSLANEELLKLALKYQLTTLAGLCRIALNKIETTQMVNLTSSLHDNLEIQTSIIRPNEDTEIFFDRTTSSFQSAMSFTGSENGKSKCMMKYRNENIFSAYFAGEEVTNITDKKTAISKPVVHFSCSKHRKFGLKIENVYCKQTVSNIKWLKMESKHFQKNAELLQHFTAQLESDIKFKYLSTVSFDIKMVSTIGNYYYEMMDDAWINDFWTAASDQLLTDVEIFVGTVKVMEAHRVILSARSPVMNAALNEISDTGKSVFKFDAEFDVDIVKLFLYFLYTGSLKFATSESPNYKQLLKLATKYEVETLKNICQLANHVPDVEELTNCLLLL